MVQYYEAMRTIRAQLKYALRYVKKQEHSTRGDSLARDLYDNDVDGFWKAVHKMNACITMCKLMLLMALQLKKA